MIDENSSKGPIENLNCSIVIDYLIILKVLI